MRCRTLLVSALLVTLLSCTDTEPGDDPDSLVGRWAYARWEFDHPDGVIEYLTITPASGSLEIRADSSFRLEEFAIWVAGPYVQILEGRAAIEGNTLTLEFPGGSWRYHVGNSNDMHIARGPLRPSGISNMRLARP